MKKKWVTLLLIFPIIGMALKTLPTFDFKKINLPNKSNFYLACPDGYCQGKQNEKTPVFNVSREALEQAWQTVKKSLPRTRLVWHDQVIHQYLYIQRSPVFRFPDYIFVQFVSLGKNKSTVMMYSHARYGYYDFHINKKRVQKWVALLIKALPSS